MPGWTPPGDGKQVKPSTPGYTMSLARACVELSVVQNTLATWRARKVGPNYRKAGPSVNDPVFYDPDQIAAVKLAMGAARLQETKATVRKRIAASTKARPRRKTA